MKAVKEYGKVVQGKGFDFSWASGHGQHTLDKHDRDSLHHVFLAGCHVWPHFLT